MPNGYGRGFRRRGWGFGFRGSSPPRPYVGLGRGGLPRCGYFLSGAAGMPNLEKDRRVEVFQHHLVDVATVDLLKFPPVVVVADRHLIVGRDGLGLVEQVAGLFDESQRRKVLRSLA